MHLKNKAKVLISNEFVQHTATLLSGNMVAQLISILAYPLLSRLFTPDDFGVFSLFLSIAGLLILLSTGGFHYAILTPKGEKEAFSNFQVCLLFNLLISSITSLGLLFSTEIAVLFKTQGLKDILYLLPIYVFTGGLWVMLNHLLIRQKKFKTIAGYQVGLNGGNSIGKLLFGYFKTPYGLIIGNVIGQSITVITTFFCIKKTTLKKLFTWNWVEIKSNYCRYNNYVHFSLPRNIINFFGGNLPILLLTPFFSIKAIGLFGMALALAFRPINLLINSVSQSLYQKCTENRQKAIPIKHIIYTYLKKIALYGAIGFSGLYFILPPLTSLLLGKEWLISGEYIQLMLPWLFIITIVHPLAFLPDLFETQKTDLFFEILVTASRLIALLIGIYLNNFKISILLYSLASFLAITIRGIWFISLVQKYEKELIA